MIISQGHIVRNLKIDRKPLGADVSIKALCGQGGKIKDLSFDFLFPELGETPQQAVNCEGCLEIISKGQK